MAMNVFASTYIHALDGRLRIKLPKIKRALREAREVDRHLQQLTGVESVSANPTTGNVLILYNPGVIEQKEIIFFLIQSGYLPQLTNGAEISVFPSTMERLANTVATTIMEAALGRLIGALI